MSSLIPPSFPVLVQNFFTDFLMTQRETSPHTVASYRDTFCLFLRYLHESPATTHQYVEADLAMKEAALKKLQSPSTKRVRYRPTDELLAFLEAL